MDITEQAEKYAEGKANQAITQAIRDAYIEGYKAGYKDREEEIPMDLRDNKTEYIDLGLPSGTLWAADYEKQNGKNVYLTYDKAKYFNLPTKEQLEELKSACRWKIEETENVKGKRFFYRAECIGPNGQFITFNKTGYKETINTEDERRVYFWLEDNNKDIKSEKSLCKINGGWCNNIEFNETFCGYKLPIRQVK